MHGRVRIPPRMIYMTLRGSTQFVGSWYMASRDLNTCGFLGFTPFCPCSANQHVWTTLPRRDETRSRSHKADIITYDKACASPEGRCRSYLDLS